MDVSHTEHSHVIGKGGNNIKKVMQDTGCHIHFPDSNRNTQAEKSNQVCMANSTNGTYMTRTIIQCVSEIVETTEITTQLTNQVLPMPARSPTSIVARLKRLGSATYL
jgi:protein bicaudal C